MDVRKIIVLCGGRKRICDALGVGRTAVCAWQRRGIPERHWSELLDLGSGKVRYEDLIAQERRLKSRVIGG